MQYRVNLFRDTSAGVWIAVSADVKGLALEAASLDTLVEQVQLSVPDLLSLNQGLPKQAISLRFSLEVELGANF